MIEKRVIGNATLYLGDARAVLAGVTERVQMCVTSPPYWGLRDYGVEGQLGLESTPGEYVANMVEVFRLVREVLADDGTLWLNLGDSYAGSWGAQSRENAGKHAPNVSAISASQVKAAQRRESKTGAIPVGTDLKPKDLVGIPWMLAFALRADGWYLRSDIIWHKPNPMPESVTDRPTKSHEYLFLLSKRERYYYDAEAIKEESNYVCNSARSTLAANGIKNVQLNQMGQRRTAGSDTFHKDEDRTGRNRRTVWTIATQPYAEAHFATFPTALVEPCVIAGSRRGDVVLDPFMGSGTVGEVCANLSRGFVGIELSPTYYGELACERIENAQRQEKLFA